MHIHRSLTDQRGFTVAEVLIACVIMTLAFVALATIVPIATYAVQEGYQLSTATFLAEQKLEQAKNLPWTGSPAPGTDCLGVSATSSAAPTIPAGGATCTLWTAPGCTSGVSITSGAAIPCLADEASVTNFTAYSRNVRVTNCGATPCGGITDAGMRQVTVTVTYTSQNATAVAGTAGPKAVQAQMVVSQR